jgi:hypothetical protein
MNKPAAPNRWFSGLRATARPAYEDPADYGTAFGLDLSLNELVHEPVPPLKPPPGWMQRLTSRRAKPAA